MLGLNRAQLIQLLQNMTGVEKLFARGAECVAPPPAAGLPAKSDEPVGDDDESTTPAPGIICVRVCLATCVHNHANARMC